MCNKEEVARIKSRIEHFSEQEAVRVTLKFLRQRGFRDAFTALLAQCGGERGDLQLEAGVVRELYDALVVRGDYSRAEQLIDGDEMAPLFSKRTTSRGQWRRLVKNGQHEPWPCPRGGHQMVVWSPPGGATGQIGFLFGGWTGGADLGDFWSYEMATNRWRVINAEAVKAGGPCARSCHKMAIDNAAGMIYTLGRYVDNKTKQREPNITSDFFQFDIRNSTWRCISADVEQEGGPPLIFDHQVVFDGTTSTLWCFGGRIIASSCDLPLEEQRMAHNTAGSRYSGLYRWVS